MKYAIQSNINGKFLSNMFENSHNKIFQGRSITSDVYFWNNKAIAESIANKENGKIIEVSSWQSIN